MTQDTSNRLHTLIDRLSRVLASDDWADGLNPAQRSALSFLARANRFSRSPSHLADYMCTTRGTASQTLKALAGKELIERDAPTGDKRSIAYRLTASGAKIAGFAFMLELAFLNPRDIVSKEYDEEFFSLIQVH